MTRREAQALYDRGREPTVRVLLDLSSRLEEAEEKLRADSTNSSKPPSSDPPSVTKKRTARGKRKPGGQPGHEGKTRELLPEDKVDNFVPCKPAEQCQCGGRVHLNEKPQRHQVIELPEVSPQVTDFQIFSGVCEGCGRIHWGELPPGVPPGMLGPRAMAVVAVLSGKYHLSKRQVEEILEDLLGIEVSLGTVSNTESRVIEALEEPVEQAKSYVQQQAVVHADETGHKQGGRKAWLWVGVTSWVSVFLVRCSRGAVVAKELLGEAFKGHLVSDRWSAYGWVPVALRQLCWAHLKRDFQKISERGGRSKEIGNALLKYVQKMWHLWHQCKSGNRSRRWFQREMKPIRRGVERLLMQGKSCGHSKTEETCKRILKLKVALWTFVDVPGVEPTNNLAELIIRQYVLWRKVSYGTQSERGNLFVERMMTVSATCKQQHRSVLDYVTGAIEAHLLGQPIPSLLPQQSSVDIRCAA